jgi:hypothetical protein
VARLGQCALRTASRSVKAMSPALPVAIDRQPARAHRAAMRRAV